jgi:hypothetical protein
MTRLYTYRTVGYLIGSLLWALTHELVLAWAIFFTWGLLMALWEQPTHSWDTSIFKKWGWLEAGANMFKSSNRVTKFLGLLWPWDDMFHITKSLSIALLAFTPLLLSNTQINFVTSFGLAWLTTESFNLFYNHILRTK